MAGGRTLRTGIGAMAVMAAVAWMGGKAWSSGRLPVATPIVVSRAFTETADTVRRNETLSDLFARHRIAGAPFLDLLARLDGLDPRRVRAGTVFELRYAVGDSVPERIRTRVSDTAFLVVDRTADGSWRSRSDDVAWTVHTERVAGTIRASLDQAVHDAIPDSIMPRAERSSLVYDLADGIFAWQIDFFRDFYPGDAFVFVYERLTSSVGDVRYGRVLAASMETRGRDNRAYVLSDDHGRNAYYDERAQSLRRAFKMYPVAYSRVSSNFSLSRMHPVLRTQRAHLGTDYAANVGTRVEVTGAGTVTRAGRWGSYGNVVTVRHPNGIETRYAHLSGVARGIRTGVRVEQGQTIGYVGSTGLANGPHVHYEFVKNGRHLNPRRVDLGNGTPVPAPRRTGFDSLRVTYDRLLGRGPASPAKVD
ncbi:MAG TPA: peptidoglycan DD-metalloendopeptidase family protein [Gemmatimonadales bacterium]